MQDLLSIGTNRRESMIGTGIGLGLSGYRLATGPAFIPTDISGLSWWLDASDSSTLFQSNGGSAAAVDGDPVGYWTDKSTTGCHLSQADGLKKPVLKVSVKNSKNAVRWDSVNDSLGNTASAVIGDNFTLFIAKSTSSLMSNAAFRSSTKARSFFFDQKDGGGSYDYHGYGGVSEPNARYNATSPGTTLIQTLTVFSGLISTFHKNGVQQTSNGSNVHGILTNNNSLDFLGCDLYELLIYDSGLSPTNRAKVETYLNGKWGVY